MQLSSNPKYKHHAGCMDAVTTHMRDLQKYLNISYFGHVIRYDDHQNDWITTSENWAQEYWIENLYAQELLFKDSSSIAASKGLSFIIWDCYDFKDELQFEIMERRKKVCKVDAGLTMNIMCGGLSHCITIAWNKHKDSNLNAQNTDELYKIILPIINLRHGNSVRPNTD